MDVDRDTVVGSCGFFVVRFPVVNWVGSNVVGPMVGDTKPVK